MMHSAMSLFIAAMAFFGTFSMVSGASNDIQIPDVGGSFVASNSTGANVTFTVAPMVWEIESGTIIPAQNFTGTIEELFNFVSTTYPDYEWPMPPNTTTTHTLSTDATADSLVCGKFPITYIGYVQAGIKYLYGVPGTPGASPGPAACGRVSCSNNSGIWWCNDNPYPIILGSYSNIADLAKAIAQDEPVGCAYLETPMWVTSGQAFDNGGWNVIVSQLATGNC